MKVSLILLVVIMSCRPSHQIGELVGVPATRTLEDTVWELKELNGKAIDPVAQKPIWVLFNSAKGNVSGYSGCNSFTGSYTKTGTSIESKLASTRMFCEGKMETETAILNLLGAPAKYKVEEHMLRVELDKQVVAIFHAEIKSTN
jgi:heat shock protein HslJ